jgi:hypothetical protein
MGVQGVIAALGWAGITGALGVVGGIFDTESQMFH